MEGEVDRVLGTSTPNLQAMRNQPAEWLGSKQIKYYNLSFILRTIVSER